MDYLFTSARLGFRNWEAKDLTHMSAVSADPEVMRYFPKTKSQKETQDFITRMQEQFRERGHCYFAVELSESKEFIGFIGLAYQTYEAAFTPCVDIGWRLSPTHWGKGYATEGAEACVAYAMETLKLSKIYAVATQNNLPSIKVMKKIGMQFEYDFQHALLSDFPDLATCVLYSLRLDT